MTYLNFQSSFSNGKFRFVINGPFNASLRGFQPESAPNPQTSSFDFGTSISPVLGLASSAVMCQDTLCWGGGVLTN